jgi:hypothetical protein
VPWARDKLVRSKLKKASTLVQKQQPTTESLGGIGDQQEKGIGKSN